MELSFPLLIQVSCCVIALTYRNPPDDRDDDALPSFFFADSLHHTVVEHVDGNLSN